MIKRGKTQNIIFLYLLLILLFFAIITYVAYYLNGKSRDVFILSNLNQVEKSVNIAIKSESNRIHQVVFDYSFWDEMIEYIKSRDDVWSRNNIDPIISTFSVSSVCVFDTLRSYVYCATNDESRLLNKYAISEKIFDSLTVSRFIRFYDQTPIGVVEFFGATIHTSIDPQRKTTPQGYIFIGRIIDNSYLKIISEVTGTSISLLNDTVNPNHNEYRIEINKPIKLFNSQSYKYLHFEKGLPFIEQYNKFSDQFMGLFFLTAVCFIVTFLFVTSRWINKPLGIVEEVLETEDVRKAKSLNRFGREFVKIGHLISLYISQKKSLEVLKNRAEESDRLKSAFMANMSHEIRTPLNGILGFSELLCKTNPSKETAESYRKLIQKSSDNLMQLIGDILDYSRIEAGQLLLSNERFSTEALFTELVNHYESKQESLMQKGIQLIFKRSGGTFILNSDKQRIKQIINNLIGNAIKFTEKGFIEFDYYPDKGKVVFYVKDTGIGILINSRR